MGVDPPGGSWDEALVMRVPSDLTVFLAHVAAAYPLLGSHDALARVAYEAVVDAAADGCRFYELRFGPLTHMRPGFGVDAVIAQGTEAGGHRGTFTGVDMTMQAGLFALLPQVVDVGLDPRAGDPLTGRPARIQSFGLCQER